MAKVPEIFLITGQDKNGRLFHQVNLDATRAMQLEWPISTLPQEMGVLPHAHEEPGEIELFVPVDALFLSDRVTFKTIKPDRTAVTGEMTYDVMAHVISDPIRIFGTYEEQNPDNKRIAVRRASGFLRMRDRR